MVACPDPLSVVGNVLVSVEDVHGIMRIGAHIRLDNANMLTKSECLITCKTELEFSSTN